MNMPSAADLEELQRTLDLADEKMKLLRRTINAIVVDIERYRGVVAEYQLRGGRRATIKYFARLSAALEQVAACLADQDAFTEGLLRTSLAQPLSWLLDHRAFERLAGAHLDPRIDLARTDEHWRGDRDGGWAHIWSKIDNLKLQAANAEAPRLLRQLITELHRPVAAYLAIERKSRGGRPALRERNEIIHRLAPIFRELTGKEPTSTPNGRFMELCEQVLVSIGIATDGLERAVQRILNELRAR